MSRIPLVRRPLAEPWLAGLLFACGAATACGDQKDPIDSLNGDDSSSEPANSSTTPSTSSPGGTSGGSGPATTEEVTGETPTDVSETDASSTQTTSTTPGSSTSQPTTSGETTSEPEPSNDDLCPMVDGATWTYSHSTGWSETQTVSLGEYDGNEAFIVVDTPNPGDNLRSDSYLTKVDGRLARVYKEQFWVNPNNGNETLDTLTTYGVGFLRCDEAWASKEAGWSESPEYVRVETIAEQAAKPAEERKHTFTVEGREDVITSGGKSFANCVKVRRGKDWAATTGEDVEEKLYWFCPGVGKVREENAVTGKIEELTDYSIPN